MLEYLRQSSIKQKLILSIAAVHAVLMSIFIIDLVHRQQSFLTEESKAKTTGIALTLATNSIPWVLSNDLAGLEEITRAQTQQSGFVFSMLTDPNGKVLAYHHKDFPDDKRTGQYIPDTPFPDQVTPQTLAVFADNEQLIDLAAPIFVKNTQIGWARVQISRDNIAQSVNYITQKGLFYALIAILIGIFLAWFMGNNLTKGIYTLIQATQQVRAGERNIRLSLNRRDELKTLADNFQAMLTDLQQNEQALHNEKELAQITLKSIGDGVITTDHKGLVTYMNPIAEQLTGWTLPSAKEEHMETVFRIYQESTMQPADNPALKSMQTKQIIGLANHTVLISRGGEKISIEDSGAPIVDKKGDIIGSILVFHDATEAHQLRERLTWQALHDSLTGLKNRQAFENKLDELIEACGKDPHARYTLLYIDLDQFKIVNDTVGHSAGDELLKQVAVLLEQQTRESDMLARLGGDEFALLLEHCSPANAEIVAENIRKQVADYRFSWENRLFDIGTSIGITKIQGVTTRALVMSRADMACYLAKDLGRNRIHVYREDDQTLAREFNQLDWVNRIKQAIEHQQFILYAQEITPLQQERDKKAYEILVRLQDENNNVITPDQFLPAAERFNLMGDLDAYIVTKAVEWLKAYPDQIGLLNINLSGQSLDSRNFNQTLIRLLDEHPEHNHRICFEITETTAITHMSASLAFLNRIKNYGCQLALDDFGSGFSSFSWLKTLPVDFVKIDGSFIRDVLSDPVDAAMVRAIHQISTEMEIQSIAEFVENQEISDWLKSVGIHYAQGYHYHKPQPISALL